MDDERRADYSVGIENLGKIESLGLGMARATQLAAIAAAGTTGNGEAKISDQKAVEAMRICLNGLPIVGEVIVGEGEKDEAPMLFVGERLGSDNRNQVDIAVDPLEGTNATADFKDGASSVLVATERGGIIPLHHAVHYMDKLIVGPEAKGKVDIDASVGSNIKAIAKALDRKPTDLVIVVLKRDRNTDLIKEIRMSGARVRAIEYGDLIPSVQTAIRGEGIHAVMGIGGAPEGVLSAAALKCLGGEVQVKVWAEEGEATQKLVSAGVNMEEVLTTDDLVPGKQIIFSATGVTNNGRILQGVRFIKDGARTDTLQICSVNGDLSINQWDKTHAVTGNGFQYRLG